MCDPVPQVRFRKTVRQSAVLEAFDGCFFFSAVWIDVGFLVRQYVLLLLGFARNYLPANAPEVVSLIDVVVSTLFNADKGPPAAPC